MTSDQKTRYEAMKQMARDELDHLDKELSEEVARARQKIEELQNAKKVMKQMKNLQVNSGMKLDVISAHLQLPTRYS